MSDNIKKKPSKKINPDAFDNAQLTLFQNFLCNTENPHDALSNTIEFWDSIPRYSMSQQAQNKIRSPEGTLKIQKLEFKYKGTPWNILIHPVKIENDDGTITEFYPSANEELVEEALRKIAAEQNKGFFENNDNKIKSGVVFSLYALQEELKKRGHSRSIQQLKQSLEILNGSTIEIKGDLNEELEGSSRSTYLPTLNKVSRKKIKDDPEAKWVAQFHPLVTASINKLTYRQFNYNKMMSNKTQLARWLNKHLVLKYTFASMIDDFIIKYSTIERDSALLSNYKLKRLAIKAVDEAWEELKSINIIKDFLKEEIRGDRNKLIEVIYTIKASKEFISEVKTANKRLSLTKEQPLTL